MTIATFQRSPLRPFDRPFDPLDVAGQNVASFRHLVCEGYRQHRSGMMLHRAVSLVVATDCGQGASDGSDAAGGEARKAFLIGAALVSIRRAAVLVFGESVRMMTSRRAIQIESNSIL